MKKTAFALVLGTFLFAACEKTDVPSLHEQMEKKWRVESYTKERYDPVANVAIKQVVPGRTNDYIEFIPGNRIVVDFDTATASVWNYGIIDANNLKIEGKKWAITQLTETQFHLSLNERDSTFKNGDPVIYRLVRP